MCPRVPTPPKQRRVMVCFLALSPFIRRTLFCLLFTPSPFLALILIQPIQLSPDTLTISWIPQPRDPITIWLIPACPDFTPPTVYFAALSSRNFTHSLSEFNLPQVASTSGSCNFLVTDGSKNPLALPFPSEIIAESPYFLIVLFEPQATTIQTVNSNRGTAPSSTQTTNIGILQTPDISVPDITSTCLIASTTSVGLGLSSATESLQPNKEHLNSLGAIIGGTIGGFALVVLLCTGFLYFRIKRKHGRLNNNALPIPGLVYYNDEETPDQDFPSAVAHNDEAQQIPSSVRSREERSPPGEKLEELYQAHRDMEEARRQRDVLRLDLEQRGNVMGESGDEFDKLQHQIEQLTRRVEEFEMMQRGDSIIQPPPNYDSHFVENTRN
ncbi:hypothetical protein BDZ94DRAFT_740960 [Collybia nuda]|uniref:Uncharacterized protein n=1 Tax=Collybia nuda TaxID=64659 RepID=A0A9P5Y3X3_9AGAR|nr:hypothetical protein BDZ94DRAFT_740960 [Collybia nuda]